MTPELQGFGLTVQNLNIWGPQASKMTESASNRFLKLCFSLNICYRASYQHVIASYIFSQKIFCHFRAIIPCANRHIPRNRPRVFKFSNKLFCAKFYAAFCGQIFSKNDNLFRKIEFLTKLGVFSTIKTERKARKEKLSKKKLVLQSQGS